MRRLIAGFVLCVSFTLAGVTVSGSDGDQTDVEDLKLVWGELVDGKVQPIAPGRGLLPARSRGIGMGAPDDNGVTQHRVIPPDRIYDLRGSATYSARLPDRVRSAPLFVNFQVRATPGTEPGTGTVLNIDGAIITFAVKTMTLHHPEHGQKLMYRTEVMVGHRGRNGTVEWKPGRYTGPYETGTEKSSQLKLGVKLDPARGTWALYSMDLVMVEKLPLLSSGPEPTITVRPGVVDTDVASLIEPQLSTGPVRRSAIFLPAGPDGKIDYEAARRRNDPRLRRPPGQPVVEKPRE